MVSAGTGARGIGRHPPPRRARRHRGPRRGLGEAPARPRRHAAGPSGGVGAADGGQRPRGLGAWAWAWAWAGGGGGGGGAGVVLAPGRGG